MDKTLDRCKKREYPAREPEKTRRNGDYVYARSLAALPKQGRHLERGYKVAKHFAEVIAARRRDGKGTLEPSFREHAERWKKETAHLSSITKMISHPSYLRIIGFGREGLPLILRELRERPDHWLVALNAITGEDPAPDQATFRSRRIMDQVG
jgi:hypothetical protein